MAWLDDHPPVRDQFRSPRRAKPTGCAVGHTAESIMDTIGPDTGAENVAEFIRTRTTPGSYHDLVDSDSIIHLVDYGNEAYQDGTGSNPWAYGLSFACRTTDWRKMSDDKRQGFLRNGAKAAARYNDWLKRTHGRTLPARLITREQSENGEAGWIPHGKRDPKRRTDPGINPPDLFPWDEFLRFYTLAITGATTPQPTGDDDMTADQAATLDRVNLIVTQLQQEMVGVTDEKGLTRQDRIVKQLARIEERLTRLEAKS